ncbi:hypothetical protein BC629DRAFT_1434399 [Irpex lacteus]|nr:hypothetical protein BC629DRAFT_1434399 [Irpex lacteus]
MKSAVTSDISASGDMQLGNRRSIAPLSPSNTLVGRPVVRLVTLLRSDFGSQKIVGRYLWKADGARDTLRWKVALCDAEKLLQWIYYRCTMLAYRTTLIDYQRSADSERMWYTPSNAMREGYVPINDYLYISLNCSDDLMQDVEQASEPGVQCQWFTACRAYRDDPEAILPAEWKHRAGDMELSVGLRTQCNTRPRIVTRYDSINRCAALSTALGKAKGLLSVTAVLKFANSGSRIWRGYTITGADHKNPPAVGPGVSWSEWDASNLCGSSAAIIPPSPPIHIRKNGLAPEQGHQFVAPVPSAVSTELQERSGLSELSYVLVIALKTSCRVGFASLNGGTLFNFGARYSSDLQLPLPLHLTLRAHIRAWSATGMLSLSRTRLKNEDMRGSGMLNPSIVYAARAERCDAIYDSKISTILLRYYVQELDPQQA